jgi:hypothetical protein
MTLEQVQKRLGLYLAAEEKILVAQSYGTGGQTVAKASLEAVQKEIRRLEKEVARLQRGHKIPIGRMIPL